LLNTEQKFNPLQLIYLFLAFSCGYLALAFPFSYFRHDDWLIIGNVVRFIPQDWKFLFEPYLIFNSIKETWFFRPWFKLFVFLNFSALGYHYYAWLVINLVLTLGALLFGYLSLKRLTLDSNRALIFVAFFIFSIHFHFGSLLWMGEGAMNCPQLFFLFLNFYLFSISITAPQKNRKLFAGLGALVSFMISLGFKESSIFHLPFLLILFFHREPLRISRKALLVFTPYLIIAGVYLYYRLFLLPINPGHKPQTDLRLILKPALFLLASLSLPIASILISSVFFKANVREKQKLLGLLFKSLVFFLPFFAAYLGHGFFSPGWLTAPGIYLAFLVGLKLPSAFTVRPILRTSLILTLVVSMSLVLYQTNSIKWWSWYKPQRQIVEIIDQLGSSSTQSVRIFNCESQDDKLPPLIRVVGYNVSIQEIFWLRHKTLPHVSILPCSTLSKILATPIDNTINLKWAFPEFTILKN
jgi:hypothetical protein